MPANITTISPTSANPGDQITLTGTGFITGASVTFAGVFSSWSDQFANVLSATEIRTTAPDFGGDAVALQVTVTNPEEEDASAPVAFRLNAWPPVEQIVPMCGLNALKRVLGLGVEENESDQQWRELIQIASAQLTRYVTYELKPITLTELYDGDDTDRLDMRHMPVTAVTALSIDGQPVDVAEVKVYPEYIAFDSGGGEYSPRLRSGSRIFAAGLKNVSVTYTAGFTALPADLVNACILQVAFLKNMLGRQGITSETNSVTNSTNQYSDLSIAPAARIAANRYRRAGAKVI